mmetsp:Transcript_96622/g.312073  ORF Transcript_96622/g.312073 Transcript_96622/m.312073 type:complete len:252 (-) Transcript_96622:562-1317(-)
MRTGMRRLTCVSCPNAPSATTGPLDVQIHSVAQDETRRPKTRAEADRQRGEPRQTRTPAGNSSPSRLRQLPRSEQPLSAPPAGGPCSRSDSREAASPPRSCCRPCSVHSAGAPASGGSGSPSKAGLGSDGRRSRRSRETVDVGAKALRSQPTSTPPPPPVPSPCSGWPLGERSFQERMVAGSSNDGIQQPTARDAVEGLLSEVPPGNSDAVLCWMGSSGASNAKCMGTEVRGKQDGTGPERLSTFLWRRMP